MTTLSWFQIWTVCWQLAIFVTPLIVSCAVFWLKTQFATKTEFTAERNRISAKFDAEKVERDTRYDVVNTRGIDHEARLRVVESEIARPPSRHALNNELTKVQAGLHSVGRSLDDIRHQMESRDADIRRTVETMNSYMHTLIERGLKP